MTWEWSHTPEAYRDAELNLRGLDPGTLRVIWAEWRAAEPIEDGDAIETGFQPEVYERALKQAQILPDDVLADDIWDRAVEQASCTNGGWEAWLCPFGCGCHMVPFDRGQDDD